MRKLFVEYAHGGHVLVLVVFLELFSLLCYLSAGESRAVFAEARAAQNLQTAAISQDKPDEPTGLIVDGTARGDNSSGEVIVPPRESAKQEVDKQSKDLELTVSSNPKAVKMVALTFDDGPGKMTPEYLARLADYGVKATFFVIGSQAEKYPEELLAIKQAGHEIGLHSMTHRQLNKLPLQAIEEEMRDSTELVRSITGDYPLHFRPPYGEFNDEVLAVARKLGQKNVLWSVDPKDWRNPGVDKIVSRVLKGLKPGDIIVMHENRQQTLEALPQIIAGIRSLGYEFGTVAEVLNDS